MTVLFLSSCADSRAISLRREFGRNYSYFTALKALENSDEETAKRHLKESRAKGDSEISKQSALILSELGTLTERSKANDFLARKFDDEECLLKSVKFFFDQSEFSRVIKLTNQADIKTASNELIFYRLTAMEKKNDSRLEKSVEDWFLERALSPYHIEFYENSRNEERTATAASAESADGAELTDGTESADGAAVTGNIEQISFFRMVQNFRINVYKRNYIYANSLIDTVISLYDEQNKTLSEQILSDIGRAALYGTEDFRNSAQKFDALGARLSRSEETRSLSYYPYFYAARLYDKAGRYQSLTVSRFKTSLERADSPEKFDNSLWYLLNMQLRMPTEDIISTIRTYFERISSPAYFDDFFDSLSVLLLSHNQWQEFYEIWKITAQKVSPDTFGKYSYISGRLLEEGLAVPDGTPAVQEAMNAFTGILSKKTPLYYKVCALKRLNVTNKDIITDILCRVPVGINETDGSDGGKGVILSGFAAFGFPKMIYGTWLKYRTEILSEDAVTVSRFLNDCGNFNNSHRVEGLRIAGWTYENYGGSVPRELLELSFPRYFAEIVEECSAVNQIPEELMYALIRSESFFDAEIYSTAGAAGLTQLMQATADDEARKLRLGDSYDILDPYTNVLIGSHYLSSLIPRAENSPLLALFAYNAGLTNVRRWANSARQNWSALGKTRVSPAGMPLDLFLETLPFAETREYGRKLVSAAVMYGFLYYGKSPSETVTFILENF